MWQRGDMYGKGGGMCGEGTCVTKGEHARGRDGH